MIEFLKKKIEWLKSIKVNSHLVEWWFDVLKYAILALLFHSTFDLIWEKGRSQGLQEGFIKGFIEGYADHETRFHLKKERNGQVDI